MLYETRARAEELLQLNIECPDTGLARLSYDQALDLLDAATATNGHGTG